MIEAKVSYYEYRERGGVQVTLDAEFSYVENLTEFLEKLRGPVVAPPEVGKDGKLNKKEPIKSSDYLLDAARPIKEKKETS